MIIMICGDAGSGKTFVAKAIEKNNYTLMSFSSTAKKLVSEIYNFPQEMVLGHTKLSREWRETPNKQVEDMFGKNSTPRDAIINVAEPLRVKYNIWAKILANQIKNLPVQNVVIDDLRFSQELSYMIKTFGRENIVVISVKNPGSIYKNSNHISETSHKHISADFEYKKDDLTSLFKFLSRSDPNFV
jgi:dephospho-CoA kinase